jgi:acyl carrier protein
MMNAPASRDAVSLLSLVTGIVATVLSIAPNDVNADASFFDDLGAESIDFLDLRFRIEDALGVRFTNSELLECCGRGLAPSAFRAAFTVRVMANFVSARLGSQ